MNNTTNLGLKKPEYSDPADIEDINDNMDTLDAKLGAVGNTSVQGQIDAVNTKVGSTVLPTTAQTITGAIAEHETDLGGKADKVTSATNGHFAGLDANGNLTDSGKQASDFATPSDIDKKANAISESVDTPAEVMTFADGAEDMPMKVDVAINPVQDLHGYGYPWVGGAGKNKIDDFTETDNCEKVADHSYKITKTNTSIVYRSANANCVMKSGQEYTISFNAELHPVGETTFSIRAYLHTSGYSSRLYITAEGSNSFNYTPTEDVDYLQLYIGSNGSEDINSYAIISNLMARVSSETDATFAPYSNLCPISGYTGVDITRVKEQLYDLDTVQKKKYVDSTGAIKTSTYNSDRALNLTDYFNVEEGKSYTLKANTSNLGYTQTVAFSWYNGTTFVDRSTATVNLNGERYTFTATAPTGANKARVNFCTNNFDTVIIAESGTIAEYAITFPTEAGIVYGGTLTVHRDGSGTLVVDRAIVTIDGSESYIDVTSANVFYLTKDIISTLYVSTENDYCSMFKPVTASGSSTMVSGDVARQSTSNSRLYVKADIFAGYTASQLATYFESNNFQICLRLITPVTYNFTAMQIRSLLGENNLWADSGNVLSVVYYADTKMYIDNLFSTIVNATGVSF